MHSSILGSQSHNFEGAQRQGGNGAHCLIGNLKTHEMERKTREEMAPLKKKVIAFKSSSTYSDEVDEEEDDEDLSLLAKNVRRMYNKAKFQNRRRW